MASVLGLMALCALPTPASAQAPAAAGGAYASRAATIVSVTCQTGCAGVDQADAGSRIRVRGRDMRDVREVVFLGGPGAADDVTTAAKDATATTVDARVPARAATGRLQLRNGDGATSEPSDDTLMIGEPRPDDPGDGPSVARLVSDAPHSSAVDAKVESRTVLYGGDAAPRLRVVAKGDAPLAVTVALVRASDGAVVRRWTPDPLEPGVTTTITWDGKVGSKVPARRGRYQFQVWRGAADARASMTEAPRPEAADSFEFVPYVFPIDGKHEFGTGAAAFGGGRGHEGHDVFAACGTPLVAARGGVVKQKAWHSAAGNYLVIDADGTGEDMAYMHLRDPALVDEGDHVATGERIGYVGDTGHASGCHLHFELWTAPGWYTGGHPVDPLPALQAWDR
ncbi:MAG TPA: peptidoglycan DD-metalloendopeptidase family protein [Capillimicrobium sp.]|nr:peptidoglycan DD-metalloendopeptidase family protein [Capillimicrobium sp.]